MYEARKSLQSKIGELKLYASRKGIAAILWENQKPAQEMAACRVDNDHPVLLEAERQLNEYFAGKRETFDLELDFCVGTEFQKKVWNALLTIPYGETRSYVAIARQIGNERAMRAVGAANGRNPIPIVVPCHRVIGASGNLLGFGGGLETKKVLLELESGVSHVQRNLVLVG